VHIPGATHLEWKILLENSKDPDAVPIFRPAEEIQSILDEADIRKDNTIQMLHTVRPLSV